MRKKNNNCFAVYPWSSKFCFFLFLTRSKYVNTTNLSSVAVIEAECFPQKRILFLKTHKTGSSTMANIFFRYGDARNLTFALGAGTILGWPEKFHIFHPLRMFGKAPDILCSHARFNKEPMNWLFPRKTTKYVTILRNPVDNYESAFNFAQLGKSFGLGVALDSLEKFLDKPIQSYSHSRKDIMMYLARNPMMFDLGLRFEYFQNLTAVKEYIQFLDNEFDLVMIMDYFDESLLLMKRLLCWKIEDILYVKLNERQDKEKATLLSARVKENIRRWNKADVLLFDYFNASFWRRVKKEGPSFYEELSTFRRRKQEIRQLCLINGTRIERAYHNKFVKGYSVRNDLDENSKRLCENFVRTENDFLAYLRRKRMVKLKESGIDKLDKIENEIGWQVAKDLQYDPVRG